MNISFVHNPTVHKYEKIKKQDLLPVSQRQLAQYLGISSSMMHMAESSRHPSHQLSAAASGKLAALLVAHVGQQQKKRDGPSWQKLQGSILQKAMQKQGMLETMVKYSEARIKVLANKLKEMQEKEAQDRQWLNTLDRLPDQPADVKANHADRKWLILQQALAEERLLKHSWLQQAKLEIQIEQERLKAAGTGKLLKQVKMKTGGK